MFRRRHVTVHHAMQGPSGRHLRVLPCSFLIPVPCQSCQRATAFCKPKQKRHFGVDSRGQAKLISGVLC